MPELARVMACGASEGEAIVQARAVEAALVDLPEGVKFQSARRLVRDAMKECGLARSMEGLGAAAGR